MNAIQALFWPAPQRPRVFLSYHHEPHSYHYRLFREHFHDMHEVIRDCSVEREILTDSTYYVRRRLREFYLPNTSATIVLCGPTTRGRRFVDYEIELTLDMKHRLLGVLMPDFSGGLLSQALLPDRLAANLEAGYAELVSWSDIVRNPGLLWEKLADLRYRSPSLIRNGLPSRQRNTGLLSSLSSG